MPTAVLSLLFAASALAQPTLIPHTARVAIAPTPVDNHGLFLVVQPGVTAVPPTVELAVQIEAHSLTTLVVSADADYRARNTAALLDSFVLNGPFPDWSPFLFAWADLAGTPSLAVSRAQVSALLGAVAAMNFGVSTPPAFAGRRVVFRFRPTDLPPGSAVYAQAFAGIEPPNPIVPPGILAACGASRGITIVAADVRGADEDPLPGRSVVAAASRDGSDLGLFAPRYLAYGSPAPSGGAPDGGLVAVVSSTAITGPFQRVNLPRPQGAIDFGSSLAWADLNADGHRDLVVGMPNSPNLFDPPGALPGGAVVVFDGFEVLRGVVPPPFFVTSNATTLAAGAGFGTSLAVGDFDGDGVEDVAIGAPADRESSTTRIGSVSVLYGDRSRDLITGGGANTTQSFFGVDTDDAGFGAALAARSNSAGLASTLLVGAPDARGGIGAVHELSLSPTSVIALASYRNAAARGVGQSLVAADFDRNGTQDPVVGAASFPSTTGGAALIFMDQLSAAPQALSAQVGSPRAFGCAFSVADFNGDGMQDLCVLDDQGAGPKSTDPRGMAVVHFGHPSLPLGRPYSTLCIEPSAPLPGESFAPSIVALSGPTGVPSLLVGLEGGAGGARFQRWEDLLHRSSNVLNP